MTGSDGTTGTEIADCAGLNTAGRRVRRACVVTILLLLVLTPAIVWIAVADRAVSNQNVAPQSGGPSRAAVSTALLSTLTAKRPPVIPFRDVTASSGLDFRHDNGARGDKLVPESLGSGCAFLDYNNDGFPDILLISAKPLEEPVSKNAKPTLRLFANDQTGHYTDVTSESGLEHSVFGMGVAAGDYDNDGWVDLYITSVGQNRLFRNDRGLFRDVTESSGTAGDANDWSTGCCWFDFDNDGDLDLFVCNYVKWSAAIDRQLDCRLLGGERSYCHPNEWAGTFPRMFRNDGKSQFTDISHSAAIQVRNRDTGVPVAKSLSVLPTDVNRDGWLDLIVSNDGVRNFLYLNQRDSTFAEVGVEWGLAYDHFGRSRRATGLDSGFIGNGQTQVIMFGGIAHQPTRLYQSHRSSLYFTEDSLSTGLDPATLIPFNFGVLFLDVDLDGRLDVITTNGQTEPEIEKLRRSQTYSQPPQFIWNSGTIGTRQLMLVDSSSVGDLAHPIVGRGSAYADIDADGDLDLLMTANGGAARLLRNDLLTSTSDTSANNWIRLKLIGTRCNRSAIGAQIELTQGALRQRREVNSTHGYLSQSELVVTFGLAGHENVKEVQVSWPDGSTTVLANLAANRTIEVVQD